jgi:hypothetical protein
VSIQRGVYLVQRTPNCHRLKSEDRRKASSPGLLTQGWGECDKISHVNGVKYEDGVYTVSYRVKAVLSCDDAKTEEVKKKVCGGEILK